MTQTGPTYNGNNPAGLKTSVKIFHINNLEIRVVDATVPLNTKPACAIFAIIEIAVDIEEIFKSILTSGCTEFLAIGPNSSKVEDRLDEIIEDAGRFEVITTCYPAEELDEVATMTALALNRASRLEYLLIVDNSEFQYETLLEMIRSNTV